MASRFSSIIYAMVTGKYSGLENGKGNMEKGEERSRRHRNGGRHFVRRGGLRVKEKKRPGAPGYLIATPPGSEIGPNLLIERELNFSNRDSNHPSRVGSRVLSPCLRVSLPPRCYSSHPGSRICAKTMKIGRIIFSNRHTLAVCAFRTNLRDERWHQGTGRLESTPVAGGSCGNLARKLGAKDLWRPFGLGCGESSLAVTERCQATALQTRAEKRSGWQSGNNSRLCW